MSLMQQLIADVRKHEHSLEEREAELKDELAKTRKMHREVVRHRERLERDHGNGEVALPLGEPDEEEEATDEADDADTYPDFDPDEPLVPAEEVSWEDSKDAADAAEARAMQAEVSSKIRRRKAKATAEEVADG